MLCLLGWVNLQNDKQEEMEGLFVKEIEEMEKAMEANVPLDLPQHGQAGLGWR